MGIALGKVEVLELISEALQSIEGGIEEWAKTTCNTKKLLHRISDGEVKIAATTLRWNDGIEFSCVPYKLCEGAECAFPQVHFAIGTFCSMIRHT